MAAGVENDESDDVPTLREELRRCREELAQLRLSLDVLSTSDALTGLLNRNGALEAIERTLLWKTRTGDPFVVLGVEVVELGSTGLAEVEDQHTGALLASVVRDIDEVARLGEGRYLAVLHSTGPEVVDPITARIGSAVEGERGERVAAPRFVFLILGEGYTGTAATLLTRVEQLLPQARYGEPLVQRLD